MQISHFTFISWYQHGFHYFYLKKINIVHLGREQEVIYCFKLDFYKEKNKFNAYTK